MIRSLKIHTNRLCNFNALEKIDTTKHTINEMVMGNAKDLKAA